MANDRKHGPRVLLVGFKDRAAERALEELRARGVLVSHASDAGEAIVAVRSGTVDVVCLEVPLANIDPVSLGAALKEGPAPPGVFLVDAGGQAASILESLPEELRPDALLEPPLDAARLLVAIDGLRGGSAPPGDEGHPGPSLAELLVELKERRETGVIEVRADGIRTDIYLHSGDPVLVEGDTVRETLGRLLLRHGALREEDYVRVIQRMTDSLVEHEPLRMGEALVELGLLTPVEVYEALVTQVQEKVVACFHFEQVDLSFRPRAVLPEHGAFRCAPAEAVMLRGVKAHFDARRIAVLLAPYETRHPTVRGEISTLVERFQLDPTEQRFLRGLTGERTLAALRQDGTLDALHAGQLLAALVIGRALQFHDRPIKKAPHASPAPAARPVQKSDPIRPPSPQTPPKSVRPEEALRRLRSLTQRKASDATRSRKEAELGAEQFFQRGKQLLRQGVTAGAAKEFERALSLRSGELEYQLYAAWTASLALGDAPARSSARGRAREVALQLVRQAKNHAKAHAILGQMMLEDGDAAAAEKHFRIAIATDPKEIDAERGLRLAAKRREGSRAEPSS